MAIRRTDTNLRKPFLVIVGPTGVGKSRLALNLAQKLGGEIVNADSRQIYKYMDIGTAKPSDSEQKLVDHHLLDIKLPDEEFNLPLFLHLSTTRIGQIHKRGRLPIVVGGSGQYIWGLLEGWQIPKIKPDITLRSELETQLKSSGVASLHNYLRQIDPISSARVDSNNPRRVIRAIEKSMYGHSNDNKTGLKYPLKTPHLVIGLTLDRRELYKRVDYRVDDMMNRGFKEEVEMLIDRGYSTSLPSMSSVGYQELAANIIEGRDLDDVVQETKYRTHNIVRKQYSWFKLQDPRINWLDSDGSENHNANNMVEEFLAHYDKII